MNGNTNYMLILKHTEMIPSYGNMLSLNQSINKKYLNTFTGALELTTRLPFCQD
jgi:hypothetical protein